MDCAVVDFSADQLQRVVDLVEAEVMRRHHAEVDRLTGHEIEREFHRLVAVSAHAAKRGLLRDDDIHVEIVQRFFLVRGREQFAALLERLERPADDLARAARRNVDYEIDAKYNPKLFERMPDLGNGPEPWRQR